MTKYRKKPVVIEAFHMTEDIWRATSGWPQWVLEAWDQTPGTKGAIWSNDGKVLCGTLEGSHIVSFDDWIIKGVKDEIYPCKPDIFKLTYEPVSSFGGKGWLS